MFERGKANPVEGTTRVIQKGLQLEQQIYGGQYPEMRDVWNEKISRVNGIAYSQAQPAEETREHSEGATPAERFVATVDRVKKVNVNNYYVIVEWLYEHDKSFDSAQEWRTEFLTFLKAQFLEGDV